MSLKSGGREKMVKTILLAGMVLVLSAILTGCGHDNDHDHHDHEPVVTGPGFVAIDDRSDETAPLLTVTYTVPPSSDPVTVDILSDISSDGDIAFDPVLNTFTVTTGPPEVFFGEDSFNDHLPEFRAFLTFPLDGVTGQPVVPGNAEIVSATLEVLVIRVDFTSVIPTFLDLVEYPFRDLSAADFDAPLLTPTSYVALDFFSSDLDNFVQIDVTPLMQEAQLQALLNFQVRFGLEALASLSASPSTFAKAGRSAYPPPRAADKVLLKRETSSTRPLTQEVLSSRHR
ncbi:MAG: hypothetical protein EHM54_09195 [Nitrospiraceae bacterium]|nr:MAG: hypothetical protein EHM54_09195 [Nitrospiraceae bacterium]